MALQQKKRETNWWIRRWNTQSQSSGYYPAMPLHGTTFEGIAFQEMSNDRVLKKSNRPLSTIETFALEFAPPTDDASLAHAANNLSVNSTSVTSSDSTASEVPAVSIHALDVLAEINAQKNPKLAKQCLEDLAVKYDTMRKGYWEFRMEKLGEITVQ